MNGLTYQKLLSYDFLEEMLLEMYKISIPKEDCNYYFVADWGEKNEKPMSGMCNRLQRMCHYQHQDHLRHDVSSLGRLIPTTHDQPDYKEINCSEIPE